MKDDQWLNGLRAIVEGTLRAKSGVMCCSVMSSSSAVCRDSPRLMLRYS